MCQRVCVCLRVCVRVCVCVCVCVCVVGICVQDRLQVSVSLPVSVNIPLPYQLVRGEQLDLLGSVYNEDIEPIWVRARSTNHNHNSQLNTQHIAIAGKQNSTRHIGQFER